MSLNIETAIPAKRRGRPPKTRTRAAKNIEWCEEYICLPEGKYVGKSLKPMPEFMKADFRAIYDNEVGTRRAIITRGRKNAKTCECAFILLLHLCGREAKRNSQLYSCAQSREQAGVLFSLAAKMVQLSPHLRQAVIVRDTAKELLCPELGTKYRALSADASTAFGLSPVVTIMDELGQVRGPRSSLYEAMETATAAQEEPLTVIISTQAPTDADLLSILIDDAKAGHDLKTVIRMDTAPPELDPFSLEAIKAANPAFDVFMNRKEVLAMAEDARRMPSRQAEYENLVLNRRCEVNNPFIAPSVWRACGGDVGPLDDTVVFAGLDLSEVADLTALVLIGKRDDGKWHVHPTFWLPEEGLREKSIADRVPYDQWARQGVLQTTPGKVISYEFVAEYLQREVFGRYNVHKVAFDRWNFRHLKPWLNKVGMDETFLEEHFVEFGQGYQSLSPALRDLEQMLLEGKVVHAMHPVLSMCVANTIIVKDDAGNRKPSKRRSTGRIDGLVALAMAVGVAPLDEPAIDVEALIA